MTLYSCGRLDDNPHLISNMFWRCFVGTGMTTRGGNSNSGLGGQVLTLLKELGEKSYGL